MQYVALKRYALLDWSVRLRGANPNYAPRTPLVHMAVASCAEQRPRFAAQLLI